MSSLASISVYGMIFWGDANCKFGAGQKCSGYALWGMSSLCGWADNPEDIGNSLVGWDVPHLVAIRMQTTTRAIPSPHSLPPVRNADTMPVSTRETWSWAEQCWWLVTKSFDQKMPTKHENVHSFSNSSRLEIYILFLVPRYSSLMPLTKRHQRCWIQELHPQDFGQRKILRISNGSANQLKSWNTWDDNSKRSKVYMYNPYISPGKT